MNRRCIIFMGFEIKMRVINVQFIMRILQIVRLLYMPLY